jgi:ribose transport system substrate-binding protein
MGGATRALVVRRGITMGKHRTTNARIWFMIFMFIFLVGTTVFIFLRMMTMNTKIKDVTKMNTYQYHYAMLTENPEDVLWEAIYEGAKSEGALDNAYVEVLGTNINENISLKDMMEIAIYEKVDGILIMPNQEDDVTELMNQAVEQGISVVTVLEDDADSNRNSFVGINSYSLGQEYGYELMKLSQGRALKVTVLLHVNEQNANHNFVYSGLKETVQNSNLELSEVIIDNKSAFRSEEAIRDLITSDESMPDVIVCLNATDTECAYQAVVDYNKVGEVNIIGYYSSDIINSAIEKNIITSTISFDGEEIGKTAIQALAELSQHHRVSDYFSLDVEILNKDNLKLETKPEESNP